MEPSCGGTSRCTSPTNGTDSRRYDLPIYNREHRGAGAALDNPILMTLANLTPHRTSSICRKGRRDLPSSHLIPAKLFQELLRLAPISFIIQFQWLIKIQDLKSVLGVDSV